jgi:tetratricopeptide (TPR) repeat protein
VIPESAGAREGSPRADVAPPASGDGAGAEAGAGLLEEGIQAEGAGDLERAIASFTEASRAPNPAVAAEALTRLADARRSRAEWSEAVDAARRGRDVARKAALDQLVTYATIAEANAVMCRGDLPDAKLLFEQVLTDSADPRMRGLALQNIGFILAQRGELGAAERCFAESLGQFQRAGYRRGEATALVNYGCACLDRQQLELAEDLLRQAAAVAREVEHSELMALATMNLAEVRLRRGDLAQAEDLASEALGFFCGSGNRWREIKCLCLIGEINEQRGDVDNAEGCYERGLRLARDVDARGEARTLTECLARVRRRRPH